MKNDTYRSAVDHLKFSDDLYERVISAYTPAPKHHPAGKLVLIAVMIVLLATTALAVDQEMRARHFTLKELGNIEVSMTDAEEMTFREIDDIEGVNMHYMMDLRGFTWEDGLLYNKENGFFRITADYKLEPVEFDSISGELHKNGMTYSMEFEFVTEEEGIIAPRAAVYTLNNGSILGMVWTENHHCWPVYLDLDAKTIVDALPDFTAADFEGRIGYVQPYRDGLLVTTVVDEDKIVDGDSVGYNMIYYIADGSREAVVIPRPEWKNMITFVDSDAIYCKTRTSALYRLDENFEYQQVTQWRTTDDVTAGLLTGRSAEGTLMIEDLVYDKTYVVDDMETRTQDFNETTGYNATRYSYDGNILITYAYDDYDAGFRRLAKIGMLDQNTGELKLLECHSDYGVGGFGWLDDDRYLVIYEDGEQEFICIYEFTN